MIRFDLIKMASSLTLLLWTSFAFSQPVVKVTGSKNAKKIKEQAELYLDHLGVQENLHVSIIITTYIPDKLGGATLSLPSPEPDIYQILRVLIDARLSKHEQVLVLAHEMIHVKQFAKKDLIPHDDIGVIWKGEKRYYTSTYNRNMPWEKEAFRCDSLLVNLVNTSQHKNEETLGEQFPSHTTYISKCRIVYETGES